MFTGSGLKAVLFGGYYDLGLLNLMRKEKIGFEITKSTNSRFYKSK